VSEIDTVITVGKGGVYLNIHAQPGARKLQLRGIHGDAIKIAVRETAQDGKANTAIVNFMAELLGCTRRDVEVASGHTSRRKRLFISGDISGIVMRVRETCLKKS